MAEFFALAVERRDQLQEALRGAARTPRAAGQARAGALSPRCLSFLPDRRRAAATGRRSRGSPPQGPLGVGPSFDRRPDAPGSQVLPDPDGRHGPRPGRDRVPRAVDPALPDLRLEASGAPAAVAPGAARSGRAAADRNARNRAGGSAHRAPRLGGRARRAGRGRERDREGARRGPRGPRAAPEGARPLAFDRAGNHAPEGRVSPGAAPGKDPQGRANAGPRRPRTDRRGSRRCCAPTALRPSGSIRRSFRC